MSEESTIEITPGFGGSFIELIIALHNSEEDYMKAKSEYECMEADLWLYTDWETALQPRTSKPTQKDKEFWVKKQLVPIKQKLNAAELRMKYIRRLFDVAYKYSIEVIR